MRTHVDKVDINKADTSELCAFDDTAIVQEVGVMSDTNGFSRGKVKWFNDQKGYGFITRENESDVFVHHTAIVMEGYRSLHEGDEVLYQLETGDKGPHAINVKRCLVE